MGTFTLVLNIHAEKLTNLIVFKIFKFIMPR